MVIHISILSIGLQYDTVKSFGPIFVIGLHDNSRERMPVSNIERKGGGGGIVLNCISGVQSFHIMGAMLSGSLSKWNITIKSQDT